MSRALQHIICLLQATKLQGISRNIGTVRLNRFSNTCFSRTHVIIFLLYIDYKLDIVIRVTYFQWIWRVFTKNSCCAIIFLDAWAGFTYLKVNLLANTENWKQYTITILRQSIFLNRRAIIYYYSISRYCDKNYNWFYKWLFHVRARELIIEHYWYV